MKYLLYALTFAIPILYITKIEPLINTSPKIIATKVLNIIDSNSTLKEDIEFFSGLFPIYYKNKTKISKIDSLNYNTIVPMILYEAGIILSESKPKNKFQKLTVDFFHKATSSDDFKKLNSLQLSEQEFNAIIENLRNIDSQYIEAAVFHFIDYENQINFDDSKKYWRSTISSLFISTLGVRSNFLFPDCETISIIIEKINMIALNNKFYKRFYKETNFNEQKRKQIINDYYKKIFKDNKINYYNLKCIE